MLAPVSASAASRSGWTSRGGQGTDAELNAEVDAKAHEKRNEGHRQEVEAARCQQADGSRQYEPDQRRERDRKNDAYGAHRQPQDPEQRRKHRPEDEMSILGKRAEFLVRQGHGACQANGHAMCQIKAERLCDGADRVARRGARLQRRIVHHRLDQQDMAYLAQVGRLVAGEERPPGEEGRPPGHSVLERPGEGRQRRLDVLQRNIALLEALQHVGQDNQGAAQARIGGQPSQEGRCAHEAARRLLHPQPPANTATLRVQRKGRRRASARSGTDPASPSGQRPNASRSHRQVRA